MVMGGDIPTGSRRIVFRCISFSNAYSMAMSSCVYLLMRYFLEEKQTYMETRMERKDLVQMINVLETMIEEIRTINPTSREISLTATKLEEAQMWAWKELEKD